MSALYENVGFLQKFQCSTKITVHYTRCPRSSNEEYAYRLAWQSPMQWLAPPLLLLVSLSLSIPEGVVPY